MKRLYVLVALIAVSFGFSAMAQMSDEEMANKFFSLINDQAYEFTWHYEPGVQAGFYEGQAPHGAMLRTYVNNIGFDGIAADPSAMPVGAIFVKENHTPEMELAATTYMVKIPGYNPEGGDWFWAKMQPDGTIDAAGKPAGCIGCHQGAAATDWLFNIANR